MGNKNNTSISIIIPTLNEEATIQRLIERLHAVFFLRRIVYEVIIVDDHSTDRTLAIVNFLKKFYPVSVYTKQGKKGKAYSLLGGFAKAKYDLVGMIDGDLQYQPEAVPEMIETLIAKKADIVVANRVEHHAGIVRRMLSAVNYQFINKLLLNTDADVQSGLKVFTKQVVMSLNLRPSAWTFDIEFFLKAQNAGYKVVNYNTKLSPRYGGKSKMNIFSVPLQMVWNIMKRKSIRPDIMSFYFPHQGKRLRGFIYQGKKFIHYSGLSGDNTAFHRLSGLQILFLSGLIGIFAVGLIVSWHTTLVVVISMLTVIYLLDLFFNLFVIYRSFAHSPEIVIQDKEIAAVPDNAWPSYTVFCPLYKEWQVVPQFVTAMSKLDYPKDKLQVMLLLEQDDKETIAKIQQYNLPSYFTTVIVPHSYPKTKPKACNYGLTKATGEYVVIFDAEDVPDVKQLKKAVLAFRKSSPQTKCIQAKLNFYNPHQNFLTRVFTAEYTLWFNLILPGLQSINAPIPLGGTSNHFRAKDLCDLQGWDSFNVTEDCDLGMRLIKRGYRTAVVDSTTLEEANSELGNWLSQRSRWVKGYMQTYLIHMRRPHEFINTWKEPHILTFQSVVGGKVLSLFINPIMWIITLFYFAFKPHLGTFIESFFSTPIFYMGIPSLVIGNFLYMYYYMIASAKYGHYSLTKYTLLVPIYWLAVSIAAWIALYKLFTAPHQWSKTKHGLHLKNTDTPVNRSLLQRQFTLQPSL